MHLLDSDTLTHWYAGHPRVLQRYQELPEHEVGTTIVSKIELLRGRFDFLLKASTTEDLLRAQGWLTRTEELLARIQIVPIDSIAVAIFRRLKATKGIKRIGRADL